SDKGSALDDVEFLARSPYRVRALDALADRPQSRAQLQGVTGASASTIARTLRAFEDRHWIRKTGRQYEATQLGAFVVSGVQELIDRIETERTLRAVWEWIPAEITALSIEMLSDAIVVLPVPEDPYRPVNRFASLLSETDRFRFVGYDVALLEPCKDVLADRITDGMVTEIIDPPSVANYILSTYADHCTEPLESGHLEVRVHDELPTCGICLFDDRVAISCYDRDSGTVRAFIDTDAPAAREWATSTYRQYREESRPIYRRDRVVVADGS
ncbi:MAG: helix-turn-helix transcriptional regulator, partial [Halobacteriota archaeon]